MKTDVVIVGGGPGGAASAMFLAREGIGSVIIEKEQFPRYHIGESMTGEAGGILRELGLGERMLQAQHPIKHGVKVYGTSGKNDWFLPVMMRDANHNLKDQFTWQVRRSNFDKMMLDEAVARGATLLAGQAVKPLLKDDGSVYGVQVRMADGGIQNIESQVVLDCSGQATFLATAGVTGPKYLGSYDKQIAIFSQVTDFQCDHGDTRDQQPGNALIFYQKKYHWAWAIPISDDTVSVGIVSPAAYFQGKKESKRDYLIRELKELNPELARRVPEVKLVEDVHVVPNYSFQVRRFTGKGYICIGDSHRFIDPIFSFGLYVTMKEAQLMAPVVKSYLAGTNRDAVNPFAEYEIQCEKASDVLEDTLDGFWENPLTFAFLVYHRYREMMIDVFAGRIYENQPSEAITAFRSVLKRERTYESNDDYSIPIGSRYHPERAPLWEPNSSVESTEKWMGPR
jgi:flavin-dependent dehydrogenase